MTHDDLSRLALRWLLARPGLSVGAVEISMAFGRLDAVAVSGSPAEAADWQASWRHELDRAQQRGGRIRRGAEQPPVHHGPQVRIAEVKVTRSDLLADLRARKMHQYALLASHAYLVLAPECLLIAKGASRDEQRAALAALNVPAGWGVLLAEGEHLTSLVTARRLRAVGEPACDAWRSRIGRALAWRSLTAARGGR